MNLRSAAVTDWNRDELTDPTDSTSVEKLQANADPQNNQNLVLSWFAARGRLYTIEATTGLLPPDWQALAGAQASIGCAPGCDVPEPLIRNQLMRRMAPGINNSNNA